MTLTNQKHQYKWQLKKFFIDRVQLPQGFQPLRGGSLLFTTKLQEIPDTHFIDLGRMKD